MPGTIPFIQFSDRVTSLKPERFQTHSVGPDEAALRAAFLKCSAQMQLRHGATMTDDKRRAGQLVY